MRHSQGHRRVFRRDAGRAFLRFLIGEVLLLVLCSVFYLFVLQGKVHVELPKSLVNPDPSPTAVVSGAAEGTSLPEDGATNAPDGQATTVPTIEPTAEPTDEPTPEPTATPVPAEMLALSLGEPIEGLMPQCDPALCDPALKAGIRELSLFSQADQSIVTLRAYAYFEGADASATALYLAVTDISSGETVAVYPAQSASAEADLTFDASAGTNLEQAFFQVNLDASLLPDGNYLLLGAVRAADKLAWTYFDDAISHFSVAQGIAQLSR